MIAERSAQATAARDRWCIRFLNGTMRGRSIALQAGANAIGSAPDCDVLLPDTEVQPRHLVLTAGEVAITLQRFEGAAAELNGEPMTAERRSLAAGDIVSVGRIDFQIDREYADPEAAGAADSMFPSQETDLPDAGGAAGAPARRRDSRAPALAVVAALLCAVTAVGVLLFGAQDRHVAPGPAVDLALLGAALAPFPEVHARTPDAAGTIRVNGFVESQPRRQALARALQPFGSRVRLEAVAVDGVIDGARQFVADPGLAFSYRGQGHLLVSGATDLDATHERVQRLERDLYPVIVVEDAAHYRAPAAVRVGAPVAAAASWLSQLPAKVVSVTTDAEGTRSIELANGDRFFEGAVLRSGTAIGPLDPEELLPGVAQAHAP